jgi:hypothetical protein
MLLLRSSCRVSGVSDPYRRSSAPPPVRCRGSPRSRARSSERRASRRPLRRSSDPSARRRARLARSPIAGWVDHAPATLCRQGVASARASRLASASPTPTPRTAPHSRLSAPVRGSPRSLSVTRVGLRGRCHSALIALSPSRLLSLRPCPVTGGTCRRRLGCRNRGRPRSR